MEPLYDLYYLFEKIVKRVQDVNSDRAALAAPSNQWIWPEIPTGTDDSYPRVTIQFLNIEEQPVAAGSFIRDNLKSSDTIKSVTTGKKYIVTMWVGLFVKTELRTNITKPDGKDISAKNALLGNLLFTEIIKEIDKANAEIQEVAYGYKPYEKTFALNYEDSSKRIINAVTINVPILAETDIIYNADELIETINRAYTASEDT